METIRHSDENGQNDDMTTEREGAILAPNVLPIPPGDDTWDAESNSPSSPFDLWTRTNVGENTPFPITPLTLTTLGKLFFSSNPGAPAFQGVRRFYGRLYINEGAMIHEITEKYGIPASFMDRLWGSRRRGNQHANETFRPLRFIRNLPSFLRMGMSMTKQQGPKHTPQQFFAQINQWVNAFMQENLDALDDNAVWARGLPVWSERGAYAFSTNLRISTPSGYTYALLERLVKWWTGRKELAQDLVTALPGIYSAEVGPSLWHMMLTLRNANLSDVLLDNKPDAALARLQEMPEAHAYREQFARFLQRHGHRCPNELELLNPRWAEAPEQIIELLLNYLRGGEGINPLEAERRQRGRRDDAIAQVEAKLDLIRRVLFHIALKKAQRAITIRDNSRFYMTKFIFPMRILYANLGQRWASRGWLHQADDIFFLTVPEIEHIVEHGLASDTSETLQTRIARRRTAYEYWLTIVAPDAIGPDGKPLIEDASGQKILQGLSASSGRVRGRARIVQDVREAMHLTKGDILVTQATDPGWTPVFPLLGGIVLEVGGQLSHGAIVAREYALPAVINVKGALRTIQEGQMITVDGTHGRVYLEE